VVASNILGRPREANYEAVPRLIFCDPQAAAVGEADGRFVATVPLSGVARTSTYTRAYDTRPGFLTLVSDGDRLTGADALGPEAGEAPAGDAGHPGPCPGPGAARRHPAVPDVLRGAQLAQARPVPAAATAAP
jgi:hypothetical protein